jgi:hypothetical protein
MRHIVGILSQLCGDGIYVLVSPRATQSHGTSAVESAHKCHRRRLQRCQELHQGRLTPPLLHRGFFGHFALR